MTGMQSAVRLAQVLAEDESVRKVSASIAPTAVRLGVTAATGSSTAGAVASTATSAAASAAPSTFENVAATAGGIVLATAVASPLGLVIIPGLLLWAWLDGD